MGEASKASRHMDLMLLQIEAEERARKAELHNFYEIPDIEECED